MEVLRTVVLLAGVLTMGLMAGVFMIFSVAVMPASVRSRFESR